MDTKTLFKGKTLLVTGGTGTFGRSFVEKLFNETEAKKIIIFSRDEFKQSVMQRELTDPEERLRFFLGDVRDLARLERAFQDVNIVVHAAALKQIPVLEYNPFEAVKTNVLGTQNVIDAALNNNVDKVLFVSSDKAVHPINLYGATKLCAEKLMAAANVYRSLNKRTKFSVVRYGNVLGSRGSLVETIARERATGTINLTDQAMTRFWITVDEVMGIVFKALTTMEGGELFVPKMQSLRVVDVIKTLAPDCEVKLIGIRPGEKLHEVLLTEREATRVRDVGDMFVVMPEFGWSDEKWLKGAPPLKSSFLYASNHPDFLISSDGASRILEV